jgi:hypothetical protein
MIFFEQQVLNGWRAVFTIYNGYFHLVPRLAALAASAASVVDQPFLYCAFDVIIQVLAASFFFLPQNRILVRSDALRLGVCVLALTDFEKNETLNNVMFAQWFLFPVALLMLCHVGSREMPLSRNQTLLYCLLMAVIGLTAPLLLAFVPIAIIVLIFRARGWERLVPATMILAVIIQGIAFWRTNLTKPPVEPHQAASSYLILRPFVATIGAWIYRDVFTILWGEDAAKYLASQGGEILAAVVFIIIVFCSSKLWRRVPDSKSAWLLAIIAVSVGLVGASLVVRKLLPFFGDLTHYAFFDGAARYFFVPGWLVLVAGAMLVERLFANWSSAGRVTMLFVLFGCGALSNYRVAGLPDRNWPASAQAIEDWKTKHDRHEPTPHVSVPVNPEPWGVDLPALP